jgi:transcriptional regulator with XRE-family HTH domain
MATRPSDPTHRPFNALHLHSTRSVPHVRTALGQRLRALRKQHLLSQERLGERAGLSGKFIGEVERGEKSISLDSLYRVSVALEVTLGDLTDVRERNTAPSENSAKIFALLSGRKRADDLRQAYDVLRALFKSGPKLAPGIVRTRSQAPGPGRQAIVADGGSRRRL